MSNLSTQQKFDSANAIQQWAIQLLLEQGHQASPRGMPTREVIGASFSLLSPRNRCITIASRRWSLPLAIGEFCWHASASDDVETLAYYAPRWRSFSDDTVKVRGSCYGKRMFGAQPNGLNQWERAKALLQKDPDSRRAVISFQEMEHALEPDSKDIACASTIQFLLRRGQLDAIVYMRSNDVIWGLPYDLFVFTMIQELFAAELGVKLGHYHHMIGSLHLYDTHRQLAERVIAKSGQIDFEMESMTEPSQIQELLGIEAKIRLEGGDAIDSKLSPYWQNIADVLTLFRCLREGSPLSRSQLAQSPYSPVLLPFFERVPDANKKTIVDAE